MCLYIDDSKRLKAEEDIVVYKVLFSSIYKDNNVFTTPYREFPVKIGETYKSKLLKAKFSNINFIDLGLHTFIEVPTINLFNTHHLIVAKCIIPKGAFYYKGRFASLEEPDSYASNKLTYLEIMNT